MWGYSNELLKKIDDKYCVLTENKKTGHITYDYDKRNYSTSQVNLILSSALHDMINSCECIIFLNTKNSISMKDTISQQTNSPWIYDELQTTRIIKPNIPDRLKKETRDLQKSMTKNLFESELPKFSHDITKELGKMTRINDSNLHEWYDEWTLIDNPGQRKSLDILYSITNDQ